MSNFSQWIRGANLICPLLSGTNGIPSGTLLGILNIESRDGPNKVKVKILKFPEGDPNMSRHKVGNTYDIHQSYIGPPINLTPREKSFTTLNVDNIDSRTASKTRFYLSFGTKLPSLEVDPSLKIYLGLRSTDRVGLFRSYTDGSPPEDWIGIFPEASKSFGKPMNGDFIPLGQEEYDYLLHHYTLQSYVKGMEKRYFPKIEIHPGLGHNDPKFPGGIFYRLYSSLDLRKKIIAVKKQRTKVGEQIKKLLLTKEEFDKLSLENSNRESLESIRSGLTRAATHWHTWE